MQIISSGFTFFQGLKTCLRVSMRVPKWPFVFYSEIRNLTVVPKRPFVFLQRNTKFCSSTQTVIRFFIAKYEILKLYPNGLSFFHSQMQNSENWTQTVIRFSQQNKKFKNVPKLPSILWLQNTKFLKLFRNSHFSLTTNLKI